MMLRLKNRLHQTLERAAYHLPPPIDNAVHQNLSAWILQRRLKRGAHEFIFNFRAQERFLLDEYEVPVAKWLQENVSPGNSCIDVGAHVGSFTIIMARQAGLQGRIHAVEPLLENWRLLTRNVDDNDFKNVDCLQACCWRTTERVPLFQGATSFESSLSKDFSRKADTVATTTIDEIANGSKVDLIKVDVEGAEAEVLEGAHAVLRNHKPKVIAEIHPALRLPDSPTLPQILAPFSYGGFTTDGQSVGFTEIDARSKDCSLDPFHIVFV